MPTDREKRIIKSFQRVMHADHREIIQLIMELAKAESPAQAEDPLLALDGAFGAHFATEEARGGGFETLVTARPELRPNVDRLFDDHKWILAEVAALLELLEASVPAEEEEAFAARIKVFVARIVDHEVRESKLLRKLAHL
ncbi:MAG: hemerythrin domain-containing protein [Deltaproteobacteria bacterium]|nr:hemerythrin domain-containing protein [Deltaproteobacteria bacterium]MBW2258365.1 hemerythrin domain-containing protein [Deltaproteobacteria bacterium]